MRAFGLITPIPAPILYREFRSDFVSGTTLLARLGVDGTMVNTPTVGAEEFSFASASKERVTSSAVNLAHLGRSFSMAVRARPVSLAPSEFRLAMAVGYPTAGGPFYRGISIGVMTDGKVRAYLGGGTSTANEKILFSNVQWSTSEDYLVIVIFDGTDRTLYVYDSSGLIDTATDTPGVTPLFDSTARVEERHQQFDARYWSGGKAFDWLSPELLNATEREELHRRAFSKEALWPNPDPTVDRLFASTPVRPTYLVEVQPYGAGLPRAADLVCRYEFDDRDSDGYVRDETRNAINAITASGVTTRHRGRVRDASAIRVDGVSGSRVQLESIDIPDAGWSIAFNLKAFDVGADQYVWQLAASSGADPDRVSVIIESTGEVTVALSDGSSTASVTSTGQITFGAWQHIAIRAKTVGADTIVGIHIEGGASDGGTISSLTLAQPTTSLLHFIGTNRNAGPAYADTLYGYLDDLQIWSAYMAPEDIEPIFTWTTYNRFRALTGDTSLDGYPLSAADVKPIESAFDVIENRFTQNELEISLVKDGWFAGLVQDYRLRGALVRVYLGDQRLRGTGEFLLQFTGVLLDWIPSPSDHKLRLRGRTTHVLETRKITGNFVGHPLEVTSDVVTAAIALHTDGMVVDDLVDTTTLDPSAYTTFSHWNVARAGKAVEWSPGTSVWAIGLAPLLAGAFEDGVHQPTPAMDLLRDLWSTMPHRFIVDSNDRVSFVEFDDSASAAELWYDADIIDVSVQSALGNLVNSLEIDINIPGGSGEALQHSDRREGTTQAPGVFRLPLKSQGSIDAHGIEVAKNFASEWLGGLHYTGLGVLLSSGPLVTEQAVIDLPPGYAGVSGFALSLDQRVAGGTQESWREVNSGAGRYLWIFSTNGTLGKVTDVFWDGSFVPGSYTETGIWPVGDRVIDDLGVPSDVQIYYDVEWEQLGQTTSASGYMVDATIPKAFSDYYLRRFENGCPILQVDTHLYKYERQIGDFVAIEWPHIELPEFGSTDRGITQTTVWEIVGKSIQIFEDSPRIRWTLAWVRNDTADPVDLTFGPTFEVIRPDQNPPAAFEYVGAPTPGLSSTGLDIELDDTGVLVFGSKSWALPALSTTLEASKTTLIYYSTVLRAYVLRVIATTDPDPSPIPDTEALIWDIDTDGSGVVASVGLAESGGLSGSSIGGLSVATSALADESVTDDKTVRTKRGTVQTTNATPTVVLTVPLTASTAYYLNAIIVARKTDDTAWAFIQQEGGAHRAGAGAVVDNNTQSENLTGSGWTAAWVANGNSVELQVTGAAATTINWAARARWEEAA